MNSVYVCSAAVSVCVWRCMPMYAVCVLCCAVCAVRTSFRSPSFAFGRSEVNQYLGQAVDPRSINIWARPSVTSLSYQPTRPKSGSGSTDPVTYYYPVRSPDLIITLCGKARD
jgi:hypothetical protein